MSVQKGVQAKAVIPKSGAPVSAGAGVIAAPSLPKSRPSLQPPPLLPVVSSGLSSQMQHLVIPGHSYPPHAYVPSPGRIPMMMPYYGQPHYAPAYHVPLPMPPPANSNPSNSESSSSKNLHKQPPVISDHSNGSSVHKLPTDDTTRSDHSDHNEVKTRTIQHVIISKDGLPKQVTDKPTTPAPSEDQSPVDRSIEHPASPAPLDAINPQDRPVAPPSPSLRAMDEDALLKKLDSLRQLQQEIEELMQRPLATEPSSVLSPPTASPALEPRVPVEEEPSKSKQELPNDPLSSPVTANAITAAGLLSAQTAAWVSQALQQTNQSIASTHQTATLGVEKAEAVEHALRAVHHWAEEQVKKMESKHETVRKAAQLVNRIVNETQDRLAASSTELGKRLEGVAGHVQIVSSSVTKEIELREKHCSKLEGDLKALEVRMDVRIRELEQAAEKRHAETQAQTQSIRCDISDLRVDLQALTEALNKAKTTQSEGETKLGEQISLAAQTAAEATAGVATSLESLSTRTSAERADFAQSLATLYTEVEDFKVQSCERQKKADDHLKTTISKLLSDIRLSFGSFEARVIDADARSQVATQMVERGITEAKRASEDVAKQIMPTLKSQSIKLTTLETHTANLKHSLNMLSAQLQGLHNNLTSATKDTATLRAKLSSLNLPPAQTSLPNPPPAVVPSSAPPAEDAQAEDHIHAPPVQAGHLPQVSNSLPLLTSPVTKETSAVKGLSAADGGVFDALASLQQSLAVGLNQLPHHEDDIYPSPLDETPSGAPAINLTFPQYNRPTAAWQATPSAAPRPPPARESPSATKPRASPSEEPLSPAGIASMVTPFAAPSTVDSKLKPRQSMWTSVMRDAVRPIGEDLAAQVGRSSTPSNGLRGDTFHHGVSRVDNSESPNHE